MLGGVGIVVCKLGKGNVKGKSECTASVMEKRHVI